MSPPQKIALPDGTITAFPDHMSDAEIEARLRAYLAARAPQDTEAAYDIRPEERIDFFTDRSMSRARKRAGLRPVEAPRIVRRAPK